MKLKKCDVVNNMSLLKFRQILDLQTPEQILYDISSLILRLNTKAQKYLGQLFFYDL